jgi:hypothetical protein
MSKLKKSRPISVEELRVGDDFYYPDLLVTCPSSFPSPSTRSTATSCRRNRTTKSIASLALTPAEAEALHRHSGKKMANPTNRPLGHDLIVSEFGKYLEHEQDSSGDEIKEASALSFPKERLLDAILQRSAHEDAPCAMDAMEAAALSLALARCL